MGNRISFHVLSVVCLPAFFLLCYIRFAQHLYVTLGNRSDSTIDMLALSPFNYAIFIFMENTIQTLHPDPCSFHLEAILALFFPSEQILMNI